LSHFVAGLVGRSWSQNTSKTRVNKIPIKM